MLRQRLELATTQPITSLLLSGWNMEQPNLPIEELLDFLERGHDWEEVTLLNCKGNLQDLVATILRVSPKKLVIRYDKQQPELPPSITAGLIQGARGSTLKHFQVVGVTMTAVALDSFRIAFCCMNEEDPTGGIGLESLSFQCRFTLDSLDRNEVNLFGEDADMADGVVREFLGFLDDLPHLRTLELDGCHIPDRHLAELMQAAAASSSANPLPDQRLTTLKLRGNRAEEETLRVLASWLVDEDCALRTLDLSWQRLPGSPTNYSPLSSLQILSSALEHNRSLEKLMLSENKLRERDLRGLCLALEGNKSLLELEARDCRISQAGFQHLAKSLPKLCLRTLDINGHQRMEGASLKSLFFEPLTENVYLWDLVLPDGVESKSLGWLLEWNKAGRRILIEEAVPDALWPTILERANRVGEQSSGWQPERHSASAIYYLLREKGFESVARGASRAQHASETNDSTSSDSSLVRSYQEDESGQRGLLRPTINTTSLSKHRSVRSIASKSGEVELALLDREDRDSTVTSSQTGLEPRSSPPPPPPGLTRTPSSIKTLEALSWTDSEVRRRPLMPINV